MIVTIQINGQLELELNQALNTYYHNTIIKYWFI